MFEDEIIAPRKADTDTDRLQAVKDIVWGFASATLRVTICRPIAGLTTCETYYPSGINEEMVNAVVAEVATADPSEPLTVSDKVCIIGSASYIVNLKSGTSDSINLSNLPLCDTNTVAKWIEEWEAEGSKY